MRRTLGSLVTIAAITTVAFLPQPAAAQDVMAASPDMHALLGDTLNARAMLMTFEPGSTTGWHDHPVHMVYVLEGGTMSMTAKGKEPMTRELKTGQFMIGSPVNHMVSNVGKNTIKALLIELKAPEMIEHKH